jgi:hypothetical protein
MGMASSHARVVLCRRARQQQQQHDSFTRQRPPMYSTKPVPYGHHQTATSPSSTVRTRLGRRGGSRCRWLEWSSEIPAGRRIT